MKLNKLILYGPNYRRTIEFNEDLTIISGDTTSGKSLILNLIDYCLGKKEKISSKVQKELYSEITDVYLEFKIEKNIFTTKRSLRQNNKFDLYYCEYSQKNQYLPERLDLSNYMQTLTNAIGAQTIIRSKKKSGTREKTSEVISFRDIFRYSYIDQNELGSNSFLENNNSFIKYKNPFAFEMIMDLVSRSHNEWEQKRIDTNNEKIKLQNRQRGLKFYLSQRGTDNKLKLLNDITTFEKNIEDLNKRKNNIINISNNGLRNDENIQYNVLNKELLELNIKLNELVKVKRDLSISQSVNKSLLNDYSKEINNIKITQKINYELTIDSQNMKCPLCGSDVFNKDRDINNDELKKMESHWKKKLKFILSKEEINEVSIRETEDKMGVINDRKAIISNMLQKFVLNKKIPLVSDLEIINNDINEKIKKLELLKESRRIYNKIDQLNKEISEKDDEISLFNDRLKENNDKTVKKNIMMPLLIQEYRRILKAFKYSFVSGTDISNEDYIPSYDHADVFEQDSGGLKECIQIAYILAIVNSKYSEYHPGVLMFDSIGKYVGTNKTDDNIMDGERINDPAIYIEIFNQFVKSKNNAQIIVVENTPPDEFNKYKKYTLLNGEYGLIDLQKNEK